MTKKLKSILASTTLLSVLGTTLMAMAANSQTTGKIERVSVGNTDVVSATDYFTVKNHSDSACQQWDGTTMIRLPDQTHSSYEPLLKTLLSARLSGATVLVVYNAFAGPTCKVRQVLVL